MRRLLVVLAMVGLCACTGAAAGDVAGQPTGEPTAATPTAARPTATADPGTPTVAPTPTPPPDSALTGVPATDASALARPVLAIKIDNAPAARPQVGLDSADIVIEELVEGGTTRFIALVNSSLPESMGPVRSGREVDALLLPAFSPVLGISGAAAPVYRDLREAGLLTFEEGQAGGAFVRDPSRRAPHNLMVDPELLAVAGADQPPATQPWPISERIPEGGTTADGVAARFSHAATASWEWDGARWLRSQDGDEHVTAQGSRIAAANVVIAQVDVTRGSRTDSSGAPTVDIRVTGGGDVLILRDGRAFEGQWQKDAATDQFQWLDADGTAVPLAPGATWIELLPAGGEAVVDRPGQDAEPSG